MFTADTELWFLSVPQCDPTYKNVLSFNSELAEISFYQGCLVKKIEGCRPTRDYGDYGTFLVDGTPDEYNKCNMAMFRTPSLSSKWYYAFIGYPRFDTRNGTEIDWLLDVWRTYYWEWSLGQCLVVREHVKSDKVGEWLYPESVETGEYITNKSGFIDDEKDWDNYLMIGYSFKPTTESTAEAEGYEIIKKLAGDITGATTILPGCNPTFAGGGRAQGLYQGYRFIAFPMTGITSDINTVNARIQELVNYGQINKLQFMINVPKWLVQSYISNEFDPEDYPDNTDLITAANITVDMPTSFSYKGDTYTPKNNKLFNQQFNYLLMSNASGTTEEYGYEYFNNPNDNGASFEEIGQIGQNPTIKLVPTNFKGVTKAYEYSIDLTGFPTSSISYSDYANERNLFGDKYYRAQMMSDSFQAVNDVSNSALGMIGNAAGEVDITKPGSVVSAATSAASGALNLSNTIAQHTLSHKMNLMSIQAHYREPQVTKGNANPNIMYARGAMRFTYYKMQITPKFAKLIDDYLSADGYAVNQFKQPNLTGRKNWNYLQLAEPVVKGNLPLSARDKLNTIFTNGVRIWHNPATWCDYTQDNSIVGGV